MRPRIQIVRTPEAYPFEESQPSGAGFVLIGAFAIGLGLYVLALVIG